MARRLSKARRRFGSRTGASGRGWDFAHRGAGAEETTVHFPYLRRL